MNLSGNDKQALISHRIDKAKQTIEDVEFLIKNNKFLLAVNRIYYAVFYCLSALALKYDFTTSKHQQLIGWFNKTFIKDNLLDKKYGKFIVKTYEDRSTGNYDDFAGFTEEDVRESFEDLKDFYNKIKEMIHDEKIR